MAQQWPSPAQPVSIPRTSDSTLASAVDPLRAGPMPITGIRSLKNSAVMGELGFVFMQKEPEGSLKQANEVVLTVSSICGWRLVLLLRGLKQNRSLKTLAVQTTITAEIAAARRIRTVLRIQSWPHPGPRLCWLPLFVIRLALQIPPSFAFFKRSQSQRKRLALCVSCVRFRSDQPCSPKKHSTTSQSATEIL